MFLSFVVSFITKFSDLRSNQTEGLYEIMLPSCDRHYELQAEWTSRDYAAQLWGAESYYLFTDHSQKPLQLSQKKQSGWLPR